jgi:hypothetical protein
MKRVFLYTSLSFMAGFLVAGCMFFFWMRWRLGWADSVHAASDAGTCLEALYPLRAGNADNATSRLETCLDGDILALATMPQTEIVTGALGRVGQYRAKYPYRSGDKGIDAATQNLLSGVEAK